jgi:hypothetical protein
MKDKTSSLVDNVNHLSKQFESEMVGLVERFKTILNQETLATKDLIR